MEITSVISAEKVTLVGELFRATEELQSKAEEVRAQKREEEIEREKLKDAAQVDERTLRLADEESPNDIEQENTSPNHGITFGAPATGSVIDITA